jgi:hypothetical protein
VGVSWVIGLASVGIWWQCKIQSGGSGRSGLVAVEDPNA